MAGAVGSAKDGSQCDLRGENAEEPLYHDFVSGWGAACVETCVMYPLSKLIFRQQLHGVPVKVFLSTFPIPKENAALVSKRKSALMKLFYIRLSSLTQF